ncbi:outer membrane protein OmpA-like peptidoglycan-associated protein [Neorhizobium galegae]|uniref:OmpA family protein n=1 Tax=Neorhizobium galegae TaxID=399 RepID=UPI0027855536|nr:OmpA family protein [Neorhizobium galegae]MDQ0135343.1 outer membrane protein OmpA-like peptidoglycan-associated protein [Neorhizobium galegae]
MSKKFRLFASVAAPFVSLPLMLQPAAAAPLKPAMEMGPAVEATRMPGVVEVQQQIIVPPEAQEGEGRPRRKPQEEQKQAPQAERPQAPPQAQQQEQPQRQRKAEPEAAPREVAPREAAPRQAPQAERPAAEAPAQERPRRQQQETGQGQGQGQGQGGNDAQPRRQREQATPQTEQPAAREAQQPKAAPTEKQAETPKPERPATNRAATPEAAPEAPVRRDAQQPKAAPAEKQAETPKPQPPATNRAATPEATPEKPASGNAQDRNAAPSRNQAETPKPPQAPATDRAATPGAAPENPARGNATGQAPAQVPGQAPGTGTAQDRRNQPPADGQAAPGQQPAAEAPRRQTTEGQPPVAPSGQPLPGQPQGQQATGAQPGTQPTAPQTATTPQQVERAKELAKDPAAAKSGEQVVLPVQNGAAVLDSAKEAPSARPPRDGERPRRPAPQQADQQQLAPPKSDAEAQGSTRATREQLQEFRQLSEERGQRLDQRPQFERPRGWDFRDAAGLGGSRDRNGGRDRDGGRVIISIDNQSVVRHDDSRRFYNDRDRAPQYEQLRDGRVREVIVRDDGTRIVTVRNSYGEIIQRSRIVRGGEEYVLYYSPDLMDNRRGRDYVWRDPGDDLPPMRLSVPLDDYIIDTSTEPDRDYYEFLEQPPVERVERVYSLDEVRYSARIRDKVPRIDLDTITFATGSAEIPMNQASSLRKVADAISKVLKRDPSETFLIEGHTDAIGSDDSNLVLSDERAESVARVLTDAFGIPPENLATQGYGERYLKVRTDGPEQENRRVTVRRITPLVKPVASNR